MKLLSTLITALALIASVFCAPKAMAETIVGNKMVEYGVDNTYGYDMYWINFQGGGHEFFFDIYDDHIELDRHYGYDDLLGSCNNYDDDYFVEDLDFYFTGDINNVWIIQGSGTLSRGGFIEFSCSSDANDSGPSPSNPTLDITCTNGSATNSANKWTFDISNSEYRLNLVVNDNTFAVDGRTNIDIYSSYLQDINGHTTYSFSGSDLSNLSFDVKGTYGSIWSINGSMNLKNGSKTYVVTFDYVSGTQIYLTNKYASYYNATRNTILPANVSACVAYINSVGDFIFKEEYKKDEIVPAGVPVILKMADTGYFSFVYTNTIGTSPAKNDLKVAEKDYTAADMEEANEDSGSIKYKYFALSKDKSNEKMGFYFMNANGSAFGLDAGKCYFVIDRSASARTSFVFDDEISAISAVAADEAKSQMFNINGQRTSEAKGLVVRDGKMMFVK